MCGYVYVEQWRYQLKRFFLLLVFLEHHLFSRLFFQRVFFAFSATFSWSFSVFILLSASLHSRTHSSLHDDAQTCYQVHWIHSHPCIRTHDCTHTFSLLEKILFFLRTSASCNKAHFLGRCCCPWLWSLVLWVFYTAIHTRCAQQCTSDQHSCKSSSQTRTWTSQSWS